MAGSEHHAPRRRHPFARPWLEALEDRRVLSVLIPVTNHRDIVFDATRNQLDITTNDGKIQRYDVASQSLLSPYTVGTELNGADITANGNFLYVMEDTSSNSTATIHKVNLANGNVTDITYANGDGAWDIALLSNGLGFITSKYPGSGPVNYLQINLSTDAISQRSDVTQVEQNSNMARSADRSVLFLAQGNISDGPVFSYDAISDSVIAGARTQAFADYQAPAVNRDGTLIAQYLYFNGIAVVNPCLEAVEVLPYYGGFCFDPVRDLLYAGDADTDQIVAIDTNTWTERFRLDIGENIGTGGTFGNGVMTVSSDSTHLFIATNSGVRMLDLPATTGVARSLVLEGVTSFTTPGTSTTFTVKAIDASGKIATGYRGTVNFSSTDTAAGLPASYTFTASDQGAHTFTLQTNTVGTQSLTVTGTGLAVASTTHTGIVVHAPGASGIPVNRVSDHVYDATRNMLYISTKDGHVQRYDVAHETLLSPWFIGGSLRGTDITTDGRFLYIADAARSLTQAFVRKVDTSDGSFTRLVIDYNVGGTFDLNITSDNRVLFDELFEGSGAGVPLHQIDIATDRISVLGSTYQDTEIYRGADRSFFVLTTDNGSSGFDTLHNQSTPGTSSGGYNHMLGAVNHDGSLNATTLFPQGGTVYIRDAAWNSVRTLTGLIGGVGFDPVRPILYAVDDGSNRIIAYDTNTWSQLFTIPVGFDIGWGTAFDTGVMSFSSDGSLLFLSVNPGVRVYSLTTPGIATVESRDSTDVAEGGAGDTVAITLTAAPTANVTVTFAPDTQVTVSPMSIVFTPSNWSTPQMLTVQAVEDAMVDGLHRGFINAVASSADVNYNGVRGVQFAAKIVDNDDPLLAQTSGSTRVVEGGATDSFTLKLRKAPSADVTVTLAPDNQLGLSATSLVFTPGNWSTAQTVIVSANDDTAIEGYDTGAVTFTFASVDTQYAGWKVADLLVQITDNDSPGIVVAESAGATTVSEGGPGDTYTVALTIAPQSNVTIDIDPGSALTASPGSIVFTPSNWNVPQTVTVKAVDNASADGTRIAVVTHDSRSVDRRFCCMKLSGGDVIVTISDNDTAGVVVTESGGSTDVVEGGATDTYTVVLIKAPTGNVTITPTPDGQSTVAPTKLIFTPANWAVPQTVVVAAVDDKLFEGPHSGLITHAATSSDPAYDQIGVASVVPHITDNDRPEVLFTPGGRFPILENTDRIYRAVLNMAPTADVTVSLVADAQLSLSVTALVFTPANWNVPQTTIVTALDNDDIDGNRLVQIQPVLTTSDPVFSAAIPSAVEVDIIDDDNTLIVTGRDVVDAITVIFSSSSLIQTVVNGKSTYYSKSFSQVVILAGDGNDMLRLMNPRIPVAILAGPGNDKLLIDGQPGANTFAAADWAVTVNGSNVELGDVENVVLTGKTGVDTFTLDTIPPYALSLQGMGGLDRVTAPDRDNAWSITGVDSGVLDGTVTFAGIDNLTGGSGDDSFVFAAGRAIHGRVDGGGGTNTLDFSAYKTPILANLQKNTITGTQGFSSIASIVAGSGSDKLVGADADSTWTITSANAGTVGTLRFAGFENLTGGAAIDRFVFVEGALLKGRIDGGLGSDTLDYGGVSSPISVNLQSKLATGMAGWLGLENFIAGSGTDRFIGANRVSTWTFTGAGSAAITGGYSFQNFENLVGGSFADTFDLAGAGDWLGLLDGGSGSDTLVAPAGASYVLTSASSGTLNGRLFRSVEVRR